jgi:hypothetical protein
MQLSGSVTNMKPTHQLCIACCCVQTALTSAKTDKTVMGRNMKKTDALLRDMVMITLRTDLTRIQRTNLETCITVHMHQKESTEDLVRKKVCAALVWWLAAHPFSCCNHHAGLSVLTTLMMPCTYSKCLCHAVRATLQPNHPCGMR